MKQILTDLTIEEFFNHWGVIKYVDSETQETKEIKFPHEYKKFEKESDIYFELHDEYPYDIIWGELDGYKYEVGWDDDDSCERMIYKGYLSSVKDANKVTSEEIWNLDDTIIKFLLPRLTKFEKETQCYPGTFESLEDWKSKLNDIIASLAAYGEMDEEVLPAKSRQDRVQYGLNELKKYFFYLWW